MRIHEVIENGCAPIVPAQYLLMRGVRELRWLPGSRSQVLTPGEN